MKKEILCFLSAAILTCALTGCGGSSESSSEVDSSSAIAEEEAYPFVGKWQLSALSDGDNMYLAEDMIKEGYDRDGLEQTYEFKSDGSVHGRMGELERDMEYEVEDELITLTNGAKFFYDNENDVLWECSDYVDDVDNEAGKKASFIFKRVE